MRVQGGEYRAALGEEGVLGWRSWGGAGAAAERRTSCTVARCAMA